MGKMTPPISSLTIAELKAELAQISGAITVLQQHKANLQQQIVSLKAKQG